MESRLTAMILEFIKEVVELKHTHHHCDLLVHDIQLLIGSNDQISFLTIFH